jgi:hypothetical protein
MQYGKVHSEIWRFWLVADEEGENPGAGNHVTVALQASPIVSLFRGYRRQGDDIVWNHFR